MRQLLPELPRQWIPWDPSPKQWAALALQHVPDVFYGGAGYGGKSVWLLMEAALYVDTPGYAAIIFRDSYPALTQEPEGLIPLAHRWWDGTPARWIEQRHTWRFPSGATIQFGHLHTPDAHFAYRGSGRQMLGFDECTELRPAQVTYLHGWRRRLAGSQIPLRTRMASNPGGRSHEYFRDRYQLHIPPAERTPNPGRVYIPALPDDNPHGDIEAYRESLAEMSPVDRARIETGNWSVAEAGAIIPAERIVLRDAKLRIKDDDEVVRAWDLAATPPTSRKPDPDWTVGIKMVRREHRFVIVDVIRFRAGPGKVRQVILSTAALDGLDCAVVLPQDPAQAGKDQALRYRRDLRAYRVETIPVSGDKATRASPFASAVEDGDVEIAPGPWRPTLVNELALFDGTGSGGHDDQVDAVSSAFGHLTGRSYARIRRL